MSWDGYIDNLVGHCGAGHCDKACIIGMDGALWTGGTHAKAMKITPQEAATIAGCVKGGKFEALQAAGVHLEGVKFQFLRGDKDAKTIIAKKKDHGSITIQGANKAIVIGHCPEGGQQGNLNKGVGAVVEYLRDHSY